MNRPAWDNWKDTKTKSYWNDHSRYLWVKCSYWFHSGCKKEIIWKVSDFDKDCFNVYVQLQKYKELYTYYKIDKIDWGIGTQIEEFYLKLFEIRSNSHFTKNKIQKGLFSKSTNFSSHMPYKEIQLVETLKNQIESSKAVSRLHSLILNTKVQDYIENTKIKESDIKFLLDNYWVDVDKFSRSIPPKNHLSYPDNWKIKKNIDDDIVAHCNRKIMDWLKQRDQEIINLKKEHEHKIAKLTEDQDLFCKTQIQIFKKEKTAEVALRMESMHREMDYVRSSHLKEKQEMMDAIRELNDIVLELTQNSDNNYRKIEGKTDKVYDSEELDVNNYVKVTIDCSKNEDFEKISHKPELVTPKMLFITNFDKIEISKLSELNSFLEKCANADWKELVIESNAKNYSEFHSLKESASVIFPYVSELITLKGFNIDSISLNQLIESIYNVKILSLIDWWIDIKSELKLGLPLEFKLKSFNISNISVKDDGAECSIESKAKALFEYLNSAELFKNLENIQISRLTRFEQIFSKLTSTILKRR